MDFLETRQVKVPPVLGNECNPKSDTQLFFTAKSLQELQSSYAYRQKAIASSQGTLADLTHIKSEIPVIEARFAELHLLSHLQDEGTVRQAIQNRKRRLQTLTTSPPSVVIDRHIKATQVELDALTDAKARIFFGKKTPQEKQSSLAYRQKMLKGNTLSDEDRERFTREIPIIQEIIAREQKLNGDKVQTLEQRVQLGFPPIKATVTYQTERQNGRVRNETPVVQIKARVTYEEKQPKTIAETAETSQETKPVIMSVFERVKGVAETLRKDPEARLDPQKEVEAYFAQHSQAYIQQLQALDAQIGVPMSENTKVAVCIPAYHEEKNIYRTLEEYAKLSRLQPGEIEIDILDNHRVGKTKDGTEQEVRRFQKNHPQLKVHYMYAVFPDQYAAMGNIRKISQDIALYRALQRTSELKDDLIIGSNDADSYGFRKNSFKWLINTFYQNKHYDLITGRLSYPDEALIRFPILRSIFLVARGYSIVSEKKNKGRTRKYKPAQSSSGAVTFYRASMYAAVGGYNSSIIRGSDTNIGTRIRNVRKNKYIHTLSSNIMRVKTDPRRALSKMIADQHWVNEWDQRIWQESPAVAGKGWADFSDQNLEVFTKERFEEELNAWFQRRLLVARQSRPNSPISDIVDFMRPKLERTFKFIGIKAQIDQDKITVIDTTQLEKRLYAKTSASESTATATLHVPRPAAVSETLKQKKDALLDDKTETVRYLNTLPQAYKQELEALNRQINQPMDKNTKVAICIPARYEERSIYRTLIQYAKQKDLPTDAYEIYILGVRDHQNADANKPMLSEINRFKHNYPQIRVHYLHADFGRHQTYLGQNAKVLTDLALLRRSKVRWNNEQFVVARNDADAWGIRKGGFASMLKRFSDYPDLDIIFGKYDFPAESYRKFPVFQAITYFHRIERSIRSRNQYKEGWGRIGPYAAGGSTYMRAGIYAAIGGYDKDVGPEDTDILERVKKVRQKKYKHLYWSNAIKLKTDPRRPLAYMASDHHFIDQWNRSIMTLTDPRVSGKTWQEFSHPELEILIRRRLEEELNAFIQSRKKSSGDQAKFFKEALPAYHRILDDAHIDGEILPNGTIHLRNITRLQETLREAAWGNIRNKAKLDLQLKKLIGFRSHFPPKSEERETLERDIAYFESRLSKLGKA